METDALSDKETEYLENYVKKLGPGGLRCGGCDWCRRFAKRCLWNPTKDAMCMRKMLGSMFEERQFQWQPYPRYLWQDEKSKYDNCDDCEKFAKTSLWNPTKDAMCMNKFFRLAYKRREYDWSKDNA